jgi:hypothetical protein
MSSAITARRVEDDDDGTCREIAIEWTIHRLAAILAKSKPRQRVSSHEFQLYNCNGFNIRGKAILFPKGLDGDAAASDFRPSLGIELIHIRRSGRLDVPTPIHVTVECFDVNEELETREKLGEVTDLDVWRHSGEASAQGPLAIPGAVTFQALQSVRSSLLLAISLTFPKHDKDIRGEEDDDEEEEEAEGAKSSSPDLLHGVKNRLSTLQETMSSLLVSPAASAGAQEQSATCPRENPHSHPRGARSAPEGGGSERTPVWEPVFARLLSDAGPDEWREAPQAWMILVHALCDVPEALAACSGVKDAEEALEKWPKPAALLVNAALAWCPPLRRKLMDAVPLEMTFGCFWIRLAVVLEQCAVCGPSMSALHSVFDRRRSMCGQGLAAGVLTAGCALDLCAFALPASATKSYEMLQVSTVTAAQHLSLLGELTAVTNHSDDSFRRHALTDLIGKLEAHDDMWRAQIDAYAASQETILSLARTVCEKEEWSLQARLCLAQAEHTCANVASTVSELSSELLAATRALIAALAEE